jgi:hypothetical protein
MTAVPDGRRAADVAEIRDYLIGALHTNVGRALEDWSQLAIQAGKPAPTSVAVELNGLEEAKLFWVPPEETDVISEAATDLPAELVLTEEFVPAPSGFVVFGGNWYGIDAMTGEKSIWPMRAFRWGPVQIPDKCGPDGLSTPDAIWRPGIAISAYSHTWDMKESVLANYTRDALQARKEFLAEELGMSVSRKDHFLSDDPANIQPEWLPLGRTDWIIGEHWKHHAVYSPGDLSYTSVIEDRCLMSALWALMGSCRPIEHVPNRAERRRAERAGRSAAPVRIVTWRGPQGQRATTDAALETGRHQTVRYPVKKHWRHQAHGPGRTERKWIMIPGHWRGPEDGPLANPHETIHKIVSK